MFLTIIAAASLAIWLYLFLARGGFWRMRPDIHGGAPRTVDRSIGAAGLVQVQEEMEQQLKAVFASARAALKRA